MLKTARLSYIVVTPAHNEEAFIERTIASMLSQSVRPQQWVIVNDCSSDNTQSIVERCTAGEDFIRVVNLARPGGRHFGNKVRAFNRGLEEVIHSEYDLIGNLDADISFKPDYFENIIREFTADHRLGIAGGMVHTCIEGTYVSQKVSLDSVAGAVQLFRRECFEAIGGYVPLARGGIDAAAEITARMKGWKVRTLADQQVLEHRRTGSAAAGPVLARLKEGRRMHSLGYSFPFFLMRCLYRSLERPMVVGSTAALLGFIINAAGGNGCVLPPEVVRFLRLEQRQKLKRMLGLAPSVAGTVQS